MTEEEARRRVAGFSDEKLGRFGEAIWAKVLGDSGFGYIPLCKIETGNAPVIEGSSPVVLPDFEVIGKGINVYLESKAKSRSVLWRKSKQERHGVDWKSWDAYMRAASLTSKACGLGIVELYRESTPHRREWSGSLLVETLKNLGPPTRGTSTELHMVYWPRKRFVDLDSWGAVELLDIANGKRCASYPVELSSIFRYGPGTQGTLFQ